MGRWGKEGKEKEYKKRRIKYERDLGIVMIIWMKEIERDKLKKGK